MMRRQISDPAGDSCGRSVPAEDGFTLIELLVALTILSLSVTVLFGIFAQAIQRIRADGGAMEARALAQAFLTRAEAHPPTRDTQGVDSSGFDWRVHVVPDPGANNDGRKVTAETVSATVRWNIGGADRSLTLSTLVIAPLETER